MTHDDALDVLTYLKSTVHGFFLIPSATASSWHKKLSQYSKVEAIEACDYIVGEGLVPNVKAIAEYCERQRYEERRRVDAMQGDNWRRAADESFRGIPGRNRSEQIIFACGQQAAKHWIEGDRDNDFFNSRLLDARNIGHEFEGIDYSQVRVSAGYDCNWFNKIAMESAR